MTRIKKLGEEHDFTKLARYTAARGGTPFDYLSEAMGLMMDKVDELVDAYNRLDDHRHVAGKETSSPPVSQLLLKEEE